ncbi:hypothetical protein [Flavobacterium sp. JAS]|uniref:hypothetical protein n=1 Tax=Flavobacterium sp. JAS TaxID=2897329 RepID=UPI001E455209|nr:hypothetical protein [Flavobacterium sp. JAS]MCD0470798.1 hypothetical protein [Flavobacterium sp. JAS]
MDTLNIPENTVVKLQVNISSDAVVATNVSINDVIVKKSTQYKFTTDLGTVSLLTHKGLSVVSSFFVSTGNIDAIMNVTQVSNSLLYDNQKVELQVYKQKITQNFFIVYSSVNLTF